MEEEYGSSALLVMKSHQQKAWKTFTRFCEFQRKRDFGKSFSVIAK